MSQRSSADETLPLRTLPILEHWDCRQCGQCCRGLAVSLDREDVRRLREQGWARRPEFRHLRTLCRRGLWKPAYQLGKRLDGTCVFLSSDGLCRIHKEYGQQAKPRLCRAFPVQVVPLKDFAFVTLRRCCPAAAAGLGRPILLQRDEVRRMAELRRARPLELPPPVIPGHRRSWQDTLRVAETLERLVLDGRFPLVRRLVHGLGLCTTLLSCRLSQLDSQQLGELLDILQTSVVEESDVWFRRRRAPGRLGAILFSGIASDYLRVHPRMAHDGTWAGRFRLFRVIAAVGWRRKRIPPLGPGFSGAGREALDRPLGRLPGSVLDPLTAYFETAAASKQYAFCLLYTSPSPRDS